MVSSGRGPGRCGPVSRHDLNCPLGRGGGGHLA